MPIRARCCTIRQAQAWYIMPVKSPRFHVLDNVVNPLSDEVASDAESE